MTFPARSDSPRHIGRGAAAAALLTALVLAGCGTPAREPESQWTAERLYSEAKEEASQGNFERAGKLYERLEGRASGTALAQQAQIEKAYVLYKNGDKAQAVSTIEHFIKLHPTSPGVDYALYLQGLINFNDNLGLLGSLTGQDLAERDQQAARDSYQAYKQLVDQFPQSLYADDSRARMNYIVNSLAAYEVHVARYYFRRGAYVAAASRAQSVVTEFQQSPSAEEALVLLAQSYDRLGLAELRDDTRRVIAGSFPGTTVVSGDGSVSRAVRKPWWQVW